MQYPIRRVDHPSERHHDKPVPTEKKPRSAAGHFVSFGCTEEKLIVENVGCRARGFASEGPFSHSTGAGWVRPRPGCYRDAIVVKKHKLRLLIADPHGGVTRSTHMWLRSLSKRARVGRDATVYGAHSPHVFANHHGACMLCVCYVCVCVCRQLPRVCAWRGRCVPEAPQRP